MCVYMGISYQEGNKINFFKMPCAILNISNIILYAHWSPEKYYVYFEPVGGKTPLAYKQVTYGEKYGELPVPEREGYTFENWYTQREYGLTVTADTAMKTADDHILYAGWTKNPDTTDNGHLLTKINGQKPSCAEEGYETYWTCSTCGKMFRDANGINEITKIAKIDAAGHNYKSSVIPPTCVEDGYTLYTCTVCGDSYTADIVSASGHTPEILPAVDADNTKTGLTEGSRCAVCGEILEAQKEIPKKPESGEQPEGEQKPEGVPKPEGQQQEEQEELQEPDDSQTQETDLKPGRILKLTAKSNGFQVKWKKQTKDISGYVLQYSTNKKFTGKSTKRIFVNKKKTSSKTISKLKPGEKYFVRICTYKTMKNSGKTEKIYSEWSKTKAVTIKNN